MNEAKRIEELASLISKNDLKVFSVRSLMPRFAQIQDQNPYRHDQVLRNVQYALEKKALDNPHATITAEELSKIANEFASFGSTENFVRIFADVLPEGLPSVDQTTQHLESVRHTYNDDVPRSTNEETALEVDESESLTLDVPNVYSKIFDKQDQKFGYLRNPELINRGQYLVEDELRGLGHTTKVAYTTCNTDTLLYSTAVDTDFGKQQIFIPVEMNDNQVLYPTSFATSEKIYELSKQGMDHFLNDKKVEFFGQHMKVADSVRDNLFTDTVREMKNDGSIEVDENSYVEEKVAMPNELASIEEILEDSILRKESKYADKVDYAIASVRDELTKCGYQSQLRFVGDNERGVNIVATVQAPEGKFDIKIPVEIFGSQVLLPSKFASVTPSNSEIEVSASEYPISKEGLRSFIANNQEGIIPVRYSGQMISLGFNDLRKTIHQAVRDKRFSVAEQALNVIADKYGEEHHAQAMDDYKGWLLNASLDFKDNFGLGMRASTGVKEHGWEGEIMTNQVKLT